jgi:hypothetical protein
MVFHFTRYTTHPARQTGRLGASWAKNACIPGIDRHTPTQTHSARQNAGQKQFIEQGKMGCAPRM